MVAARIDAPVRQMTFAVQTAHNALLALVGHAAEADMPQLLNALDAVKSCMTENDCNP